MEVSNLLTEDLIRLELKSNNKEDAIEELVDILAADKISDKERFKEVILEREAQSSTGLGKGIAIPHGKSDVVKEASIAFAKASEGIDFDSLDGQPTNLFFMIAVPKEAAKEHLKVLSQLSRKLMRDDFREALLTANNKEEVLKVIKEV